MKEELKSLVERLEELHPHTRGDSDDVLGLGNRLQASLFERARKIDIKIAGNANHLWHLTYRQLPSYSPMVRPELSGAEYDAKMAEKYLEVYKVVDVYLKTQE